MKKLILTTALVGLFTAPAFATTEAEAELALLSGECVSYLVPGTNYYNFPDGCGQGGIQSSEDGENARIAADNAAARAAAESIEDDNGESQH